MAVSLGLRMMKTPPSPHKVGGSIGIDDQTLTLKYKMVLAEIPLNKATHMATFNIQRAEKFNTLVCQEGEENWKY